MGLVYFLAATGVGVLAVLIYQLVKYPDVYFKSKKKSA